MIGSVRGRLTAAVVVVVGALAVLAALVAPQLVRHALIDDRLDAEVGAERDALRSVGTIVDGQGNQLGSPELTALFGPGLVDLTSALSDTGALDELRSFRSDDRIVISPMRGILATVGAGGEIRVDSASGSEPDGPVVTTARLEQLATGLGTRSGFDDPFGEFFDGRTSFEEFLADLESQLREEIGDGRLDLGPFGDVAPLDELFSDEFFRQEPFDRRQDSITSAATERGVDQYVFGIRPVDGVDVIVAAPSDGIALSVDRVRTALWIAVPIAMLLTGLLAWLLAGRALRPVRAITEQTAQIGAGTLHERVPVPGSRDEVAGLATVMNDMLDRLQREDRRRRQFVADASHELRSPIAAIQTQAEVTIAEGTDDGAQDLAAGVLAEAERLGEVVDDLLSLARHDESLAPPGGVVDLDDLVLAEAARPRRVPIDTTRVSAGQVRGRHEELGRVVTHLLDNAARHAAARVRLALSTTGGLVTLDVHDDGPGIPTEERERVFERFVRLDEARVRDGGGAGLGLAVVATVVTAAGGTVTVSASEELGGAHFRVTLPGAH